MSETVHVGSGKVRELFALDDERLLLVASDRISVFDVVLPTEIPDKGRVLTGLSCFWFARTRKLACNHLLGLREDGRSMECKKLEMLPIECVVRGYLAGSGWSSYRKSGEVCGVKLPEGLQESDELPEPIFTPTTKATTGHDEPLTAEQSVELIGAERFAELERVSIELYRYAAGHAREKGIILADTKFEFGTDEDDGLVLADEIFTPDSSRFWPADEYEPGGSQAVAKRRVGQQRPDGSCHLRGVVGVQGQRRLPAHLPQRGFERARDRASTCHRLHGRHSEALVSAREQEPLRLSVDDG